MMTDLRKAAQQALEALDFIRSPLYMSEINKIGDAMKALRAALAQPAQAGAEPDGAWAVRCICCGREDGVYKFHTWEQADQFRNDYTSGTGVDPQGYSAPEHSGGHKRAAIIERIVEPAQAGAEPVAFVHWPLSGPPRLVWYSNKALDAAILKTYEGHQPDMLLYTHPPARTGAEPLNDDARIGWCMWRIKDLEQQLAAAHKPPVQPAQAGAEPVAWTHGCNALLTNIELWIDACPHCGKPRTSSEAAHGIKD